MLPDIQPGNTKILYFFNCLLDGMHTKIIPRCDFSRGGLNARIQILLRSHIWGLFFCKDSDFARLRGFVCLATNLTIAEAAGRNTRRLAFHQMKSEPIFHP